MLKGVSRQIVELTDSQHPYFERAWLLVRAECAEQPPERLEDAGKRLLKHAKPHTGLVRSRRRHLLTLALAAVIGAACGYLVSLLCR